MYSKEAGLPDERSKLDVYKLHDDMAIQLLEASGIASYVAIATGLYSDHMNQHVAIATCSRV